MTTYSALCCYFGQWPSYFQLWLDSCSWNKDIHFLMITDISLDGYLVPENVHIVNMTFADVQSVIRQKLEPEIKAWDEKASISIERPYKICDYRLAYDYIFEDLFKEFDYWGYYDIDLVWGDIMSFMPENEDKQLVKIFPCGHLSFVRNAEPYKEIFRLTNDIASTADCEKMYHIYKLHPWQYVYSHDDSFYFDEEGGLEPLMLHLAKEKGIKFYHKAEFENVLPPWRHGHFQSINRPEKRFLVYSCKDGHIFRHSISGFRHKKEEISYLHISRRKMDVQTKDTKRYLVVPNKFVPYSELNYLDVLIKGRPRYIKSFVRRIINRLK